MRIAIITGASSGLGAAFACAISNTYEDIDGIWLIARRGDRLEQFVQEHSDRHFRVIAMDLTNETSCAGLEETLRSVNPEIGVLVNNAGCQFPGRFEDVPVADLEQVLELNVLAATRLQRMCTPYLARDSVSILTASVLAYVPTPGQAVYSASKAYLYSLGRALREEYRGRHGNVMILCPGSMDTEMNPKEQNPNARRFPFLYTDVDHIAATALRKAIGGAGVYTPGGFYKGYRVISKILPQSFMLWIVGRIYHK